MTSNPLVSVVIPVYNVEKYLERAVKSVVRQTYSNLEIILVDDGATDSSPELCDGLASSDSRIHVIHKTNGGLSSARNAGINQASGEYVAFLDSDDWFEADVIDYCLSLISEHKADIVQFRTTLTTDEEPARPAKEKISVLHGKEILEFLMIQSTKSDTYYSACTCLFKRDVIGELRFPEGQIVEDLVWKYKVLRNAETMVASSAIKHYYFQNIGSITNAGLKSRDFILMDCGNEIMELTASESYGCIRKLGKVKAARSSFSLLCKIAYFGISDTTIDKKSTVKELTKQLRREYFLLVNSPMPLSRKVLATTLCISYPLTELLVRVAKKFVRGI